VVGASVVGASVVVVVVVVECLQPVKQIPRTVVAKNLITLVLINDLQRAMNADGT
jgi:hypothetical protein